MLIVVVRRAIGTLLYMNASHVSSPCIFDK